MLADIDPVAKPRMTRKDKWLSPARPCVQKYRKFADDLRQSILYDEFVPGFRLLLEFHIPMPKSWSKKKKLNMVGKPHQQTPDLDNLIKSLDAIVPEDCGIWDISAKKFWAETGSIRLENKDG
tara:strand:+ start:1029 stop:1397 length:369 start_codon:yes stop_codon:yes gene_type:complete